MAMSAQGETFFTAVGCMDGRVQEPIAVYGKEKFDVVYADTITEAGLVGQLAKTDVDEKLLDSLFFKICTVSVGKHQSRGIVIHGHQECAGNPVDDAQHKKDILASAKLISSLLQKAGYTIPVVPVFVVYRDNAWVVEEL